MIAPKGCNGQSLHDLHRETITLPLTQHKSELRASIMTARAQAAAAPAALADTIAANDALSALISARYGARLPLIALAGYMPMRSEIDPLPAMRAHPGPVCVPVIEGRALPLLFHGWTPGTPMVEGKFKALIPEQGQPMVPQALIVPLLAFDRRGYRLGYGGGFYDRTLEMLRKSGPVFAVGLAYGAQEVPLVPTEPTDQPLDAIVTGQGVIWTSEP